MSDVFISRDKVIEAIEREFGDEARPECISAKEAVYSVELADVAPVVHGRWKNVKRVLNTEWGECSNCSRCNDLTPYCPQCGAKNGQSEGEE